ncbi:MAG TPA: Ig-like domain-containing protein [Acidobacteriaceae bacterium]|nr:Ig-like domain-containing protein [Acidobacteriaceae bacterium]
MLTRSAFRAIGCIVGRFALFFSLIPVAAAASHVAYVYVGTANGVYLYDAASDGSLTLVSGSPFKIAGNAIGSNGGYFVSLGTNYIHSYPVASNGAIKYQVSQINTANYSSDPAACEPTAGGELDHTGHFIYALLGTNGCTEIQSYKLSNSGLLTFLYSDSFDHGYVSALAPPTITANGLYAYNGLPIGSCAEATNLFQRQSSGALQFDGGPVMNFPARDPGWGGFETLPPIVAGPFDALALTLQEQSLDGCGGPVKPVQLASYTVDSQGGLNTTNTSQNMPIPQVYPTVLNMSPSGDFLAVGGNEPADMHEATTVTQSTGLQIFHFNGANPITVATGKLTTAPIDEIHWDSNNHLYALSNSTGKLYVYTVTSTSVTPAPGSPYSITKPTALVVVPTVPNCAYPSSPGVNLCSPTSGSTDLSPVQIKANATVTGTIRNTQLWVDGAKRYTTGSSSLNTAISLDPGTHRIAVLALNTAGQIWESAVNATVAGCTAPSSPGVHICQPANGSAAGPGVKILAAATVSGTISSMQVWLDGVKTYTTSSNPINAVFSLAPGTHRIAVLAVNDAGQVWESAVYVTGQ